MTPPIPDGVFSFLETKHEIRSRKAGGATRRAQPYITLVNDSGATAKATQELARHSAGSPLTFGTYARAQSPELRSVTEKLGALIGA